ncbi:MAG: PEP-CTERM sorting domain-containing protein [Thalassotalea sp.]
MKKLLLSLFTILAFNANAGVISIETTKVDDSLFVDFYLNDANPELYDFSATFDFDFGALEQDLSFGNFGFEQNSELDGVAFVDGFYDDVWNDFYLYSEFDFGWNDAVSLDLSNLFLGRAGFDILDVNFDQQFALTSTDAYNFFGDEISAQTIQEVPEPPVMAIFALGLLALTRYRAKN